MAVWGTVETLREQLVHNPRFSVALDYLEKVQTAGTAEHDRVMAVPAGEMKRVEIAEGGIRPGAGLPRQAAIGRAIRSA